MCGNYVFEHTRNGGKLAIVHMALNEPHKIIVSHLNAKDTIIKLLVINLGSILKLTKLLYKQPPQYFL